MIQQCINVMLEKRLDFLPLEESISLSYYPIKIDTKFNWIVNSEELDDNGYDMPFADIIEAHHELYGENDKDYLTIGDSDKFSEFTLVLCPAPTYMDLIKYKESL